MKQTNIGQSAQRAAATSARTVAEKYRSIGVIRFPVGDNSELVYSRLNQSAQVLPSRVASLLGHCERFKPLDEHAQECYHSLKLGQDRTQLMVSELSRQVLPFNIAKLLDRLRVYAQKRSDSEKTQKAQLEFIEEELKQLVQAGFLVSEEDLLRRCMRNVKAEPSPPEIATVGVVTRDRIDSLQRCLISYIENSKKYGRNNDFVVMDDSQSGQVRKETRQLLQELSRCYGAEIRYAGLEEKVSYADALIARGLPQEVVNFALFDVEGCGHTTGANRNALLLDTVGDMVFSADDDTVCSIGTTCDSKEGLALDSSFGFMGFYFFPDRQEAFQSVTLIDKSVLTLSEQLLGKSLGSCFSTLGKTDGLSFDDISPRLLQNLHFGDGKVLITFYGLAGDCGMPSPPYILLGADSRKRLTRSKQVYRSACTSREILRVVNRPTITDDPWCMATAFGYDNRELLPPFMPIKRNQDGLFGFTLRSCFNEALFGHLPWVILHTPVEARSYMQEEIWQSASRFRLCNAIATCIPSFELSPVMVGAGQRLAALGKHLTELGSMPLPDFEEFVRIQIWRSQSSLVSQILHQAHDFEEAPDYWLGDIRRHLQVLRNDLPKKEYIVPQDLLLEGGGIDDARKLTQRLVFKFGQLLYWWPEIVEIAKSLRAQNRRLANLVTGKSALTPTQ